MRKRKIVHVGRNGNLERYAAPDSILYQMERRDVSLDEAKDGTIPDDGLDADYLIVDAIWELPGGLLSHMPNLRLVHSEGVAVNRIDLAAAEKLGICVANSRAMNASAVAEQAVLLMSGCLRDVAANDLAVRQGRQMEVKLGYMARADLRELADCTVGLIGFGAIARETAKLLRAYGVRRILVTKRSPMTRKEQAELGVEQVPQAMLLAQADIVSLHVPVTGETAGMADEAFFSAMKEGSYLINTARGELVDDRALIDALASGRLRMAGLDTVDGEPVGTDHPLLKAPEEVRRKILFSPHIGGITASSFRRSYQMIAEDVQAAEEGRVPDRAVTKDNHRILGR